MGFYAILFTLVFGSVIYHPAVAGFFPPKAKTSSAIRSSTTLPSNRDASCEYVSIVTGANGYVAREIINTLINEAQDDRVICLVRPARVAEEKEYWSFEKTNSCRLDVMPYDMLDGGKTLEESLKLAYDGAGRIKCCVYHVASVFGPTEDHVQTAHDNVKGTEDVVKAIAKYPECRLVLTSSMAAVRASGQTPRNGKYYTYEDWNTESKLGANWGQSYQWSKAESEMRAWQLSQELGVPMVSICPSFVFGPPRNNKETNSFSITLVGQWVRGESSVQSRLCVDVRDVAVAHVIAGKEPVTGNRYIVSSEARIPSQDMAESLKTVANEMSLGDPDAITCDTDFDGGAIKIGDKEVDCAQRLKDDLGGLVCRPVEETMAEMGKALLCME